MALTVSGFADLFDSANCLAQCHEFWRLSGHRGVRRLVQLRSGITSLANGGLDDQAAIPRRDLPDAAIRFQDYRIARLVAGQLKIVIKNVTWSRVSANDVAYLSNRRDRQEEYPKPAERHGQAYEDPDDLRKRPGAWRKSIRPEAKTDRHVRPKWQRDSIGNAERLELL